MQTIGIDACVEVSPDVAHARAGDQELVLALAAQPAVGHDAPGPEGDVGSPMALEGTARFLWRRLLDGPATVSELASAAAVEYDVTVDQVRDDVRQFVQSLVVRGVLRRCEAG